MDNKPSTPQGSELQRIQEGKGGTMRELAARGTRFGALIALLGALACGDGDNNTLADAGGQPDFTPIGDMKKPPNDTLKTDGLAEWDKGVQKPDYRKPDLDVTPPPAPVITTNNGLPWGAASGDITLEGTCDSADTYKMQVRDNKTDPIAKTKSVGDGGIGGASTAGWTDITYNAGTGKWSWPTKIGAYDPHWFEFRAVDNVGNGSEADVIEVTFIN